MKQATTKRKATRKKMVRKQVYILPHQELALKEQAEQQATTEAELIRQAVETYLNAPAKPSGRRLPPDESAWRVILASFAAVRSQAVTGEPQPWSRADYYDDPRYAREWAER